MAAARNRVAAAGPRLETSGSRALHGSRMEDEDWLKIGVAAHLAREYAADQREFLESLAQMLERALPGHTRIVRKGGLFSRSRPVREIQVQLGDCRYTLHDPGHGALTAQRAFIKRGIVLRTDPLPVDDWIQELSERLQEYAQHNQEAAGALRRLVG